LAIGVAQAEFGSVVSGVNCSFGDAIGNVVVDNVLAGTPNMRRGIFETPVP
jgi:hypothetical protein